MHNIILLLHIFCVSALLNWKKFWKFSLNFILVKLTAICLGSYKIIRIELISTYKDDYWSSNQIIKSTNIVSTWFKGWTSMVSNWREENIFQSRHTHRYTYTYILKGEGYFHLKIFINPELFPSNKTENSSYTSLLI